jgi:hypothetical protein
LFEVVIVENQQGETVLNEVRQQLVNKDEQINSLKNNKIDFESALDDKVKEFNHKFQLVGELNNANQVDLNMRLKLTERELFTSEVKVLKLQEELADLTRQQQTTKTFC